MLLKERDNTQLGLILKYGAKIGDYLNCYGGTEQDFLTCENLQDLCSYALIQIGEAVGRLSDYFLNKHAEIDWSSIHGLRCILVHGYEDINYRILWQAIQDDLPELLAFCKSHYEGDADDKG